MVWMSPEYRSAYPETAARVEAERALEKKVLTRLSIRFRGKVKVFGGHFARCFLFGLEGADVIGGEVLHDLLRLRELAFRGHGRRGERGATWRQ